jgi:hypothetical protein
MTEAEWLASSAPLEMVRYLARPANDRKLRLFACASCRRIWPFIRDERSRQAVECAERYADGQASPEELRTMAAVAQQVAAVAERTVIPGWNAALTAAAAAQGATAAAERAAAKAGDAEMVRDVFGNPFRPVQINPAWLTWQDGTVVRLARAAYDNRCFDHLPILADALEEAGCDDEAVLRHCREPGQHARGCWVVDLLLGKG